MDAKVVVALVVLLVLLVVVVALVSWRRRSRRLRERFGPEYDRTVARTGRRQAEQELAQRERRHAELDVRPVDPAERERFQTAWTRTQADFVDRPGDAIDGADRLVNEVMRVRNYPVDDFEQRAADLSVDHPHVVREYRAAHAIAVAHGQGRATTEDLRQAMVHYRALFEELLEAGTGRRP